MILQINDWIVDVELSMTMEFSSEQAQAHCMCGYCRNYYAAVDSTYPNLRSFLAQFGLSIEGPDELSPFEPTIFEASYIVNGRVLRKGKSDLYVDDVPVRILEYSDIHTIRTKPFFVLEIGLMELPWILDEPMDEVISPANEPEYMNRMYKKLLNYNIIEPFS